MPQSSGEITEIKYVDGAASEITYTAGVDFAGVSISDLGKLGKITKVNYVADKFVKTSTISPDIQIVDLTKPFDFAEKGTLIFVVMNLDPWAEDFDAQSERLSEYKMGDHWHFTLSLPKIFSASNVYEKATLIARNGEIENYDFTFYNTNYDKKTEIFSAQTDTTYIDLQFYTRREALANSYNSAKIVTIHYQSTGSGYSGIADCPLIGTESAVKSVNESSNNLLITFAILAAVVLAVLIVLSALERSAAFIPSVVWIFGIFALLLSRFLLGGATGAPLLLSALSLAMPFVILGGAQLALGFNIGKIPVKYIFPALLAAGALFAFLCPFISFGAAGAMNIVCTIIKAIGAVYLSVFIVLATIRKKDEHGILQISCASIIAVAVIASL